MADTMRRQRTARSSPSYESVNPRAQWRNPAAVMSRRSSRSPSPRNGAARTERTPESPNARESASIRRMQATSSTNSAHQLHTSSTLHASPSRRTSAPRLHTAEAAASPRVSELRTQLTLLQADFYRLYSEHLTLSEHATELALDLERCQGEVAAGRVAQQQVAQAAAWVQAWEERAQAGQVGTMSTPWPDAVRSLYLRASCAEAEASVCRQRESALARDLTQAHGTLQHTIDALQSAQAQVGTLQRQLWDGDHPGTGGGSPDSESAGRGILLESAQQEIARLTAGLATREATIARLSTALACADISRRGAEQRAALEGSAEAMSRRMVEVLGVQGTRESTGIGIGTRGSRESSPLPPQPPTPTSAHKSPSAASRPAGPLGEGFDPIVSPHAPHARLGEDDINSWVASHAAELERASRD